MSARFVQSVTFMDVVRATREINVLEQQLAGDTPEGAFAQELRRRVGSKRTAAAAQSLLAAHHAYVEDDLEHVDAAALKREAKEHHVDGDAWRALEQWVREKQPGPPAAEHMGR